MDIKTINSILQENYSTHVQPMRSTYLYATPQEQSIVYFLEKLYVIAWLTEAQKYAIR